MSIELLEQRMRGELNPHLARLIPDHYEAALEMCSDEADLFGYTTPEDVAINSFFDNLNDMGATNRAEALAAVAVALSDLLEVIQE